MKADIASDRNVKMRKYDYDFMRISYAYLKKENMLSISLRWQKLKAILTSQSQPGE